MFQRWLKMPNLYNWQRLMGIIYESVFIRRDQIETITGWSYSKIADAIHTARSNARLRDEEKEENWFIEQDGKLFYKNGKPVRYGKDGKPIRPRSKFKEERQEWIAITIEYRDSWVYHLGPKGNQYINGILFNVNSKGREYSAGQKEHYIGITEILCRLIRAGHRPKEWYSTKEAARWVTRRFSRYRVDGATEMELKNLPRPDAVCDFGNTQLLIEYDRGHEGDGQIKEKYKKLWDFAKTQMNTTVVVWVTTTEERKEELAELWNEVKQEHEGEKRMPEQYFFVEGEETEWIVQWRETGKFAREEAAAASEVSMEEIEELERQLRLKEQEKQRIQRELKTQESRVETLTQQVSELSRQIKAKEEYYEKLIRYLLDEAQESKLFGKKKTAKERYEEFKRQYPEAK